MKRKTVSLFQVTYKFFTKVSSIVKVLLLPRYSVCRGVMRQSCFIIQALVVNFHLVVTYPQQCRTGINVSH